MINFGVGTLTASPTVGNPVALGYLQDVSIEFSGSKKMLFGSNQYPVDGAIGQRQITLKAKAGNILADALNLYLGATQTTQGATTTQTGANNPMGTTPFAQIVLAGSYQGKAYTLTFPKVFCDKLNLSFKNEDYTIPELDFTAMADATGRPYTLAWDA